MQHVCARPNSFVVSVCVPTCAQAVVVIVFTAQTFLGETGTPCRRFIVTSLLISELVVLVGRMRHFLFLCNQQQRIRVAICVKARY